MIVRWIVLAAFAAYVYVVMEDIEWRGMHKARGRARLSAAISAAVALAIAVAIDS